MCASPIEKGVVDHLHELVNQQLKRQYLSLQALQNCNLAVVEGLPLLLLSNTKQQGTYETNVVLNGSAPVGNQVSDYSRLFII